MDRDRVIALIEGEIHRKRALAEIADQDLAKAHLDVAKALNEVLNVYLRGGLGGSDRERHH